MALERTQSVELSIDGTYITIIDTTSLQDYTNNGISDPITEVETILLTISYHNLTEIVNVDITASASDLRSVDGLKVYFANIGMSSPIIDDLYHLKMDWTFSSIDYPSTSDKFFYASTTNKVANIVGAGNWKDSVEPRSKMSYSKYTLSLKKALDNLTLADENNQYVDGKEILDSLKAIL